jgi:hypothetical protein
VISKIKSYRRNAVDEAARQFFETPLLRRFLDISLEQHWRDKAKTNGNPILLRGEKFYSQNDEDGIISEIVTRLKLERGVFVEYGCGDGLENNTIQLLMRGWSGVWIGAQDLNIRVPATERRLAFEREWITRENCVQIMKRGLQKISAEDVNLISMDLDGNDFFFMEEILKQGFDPNLFIVEYNSKFPPPIRFSIAYDASYTWSGSDYFGASLQTFIDLFEAHRFRLVCCNVTGTNAFFVAERHLHLFPDVPREPEKLFMSPDYNWFLRKGHTPDARSIESFLEDSSAK